METTVALMEREVSTKLDRSGIIGFDAVAAFARCCPVAAYLAHIHQNASL